MKISAIIPARYQSTRLPGKPLALIAGEPMIRWVYERARRARYVHEVWVATDDEKIYQAVKGFGGNCRMTASYHPSGTDRIAELARTMDWDIVINVQGDEPLIDPQMIDQVVESLQDDESVSVSTLKRKITVAADIINPNVVKVITDQHDYALYFSRAPIPYCRSLWQSFEEIDAGPVPEGMFKHVGLYGYRRNFLMHITSLPPTTLETAERLEQLRILEHGFRISVKTTDKDSIGVDSPDDLERVRELVGMNGLSCIIKETNVG